MKLANLLAELLTVNVYAFTWHTFPFTKIAIEVQARALETKINWMNELIILGNGD